MPYNLDVLNNATNLPTAIIQTDSLVSGIFILGFLAFVFFAVIIAMRKQKIDDTLVIACSITTFLAILFNIAGVILNPTTIILPLVLLILTIVYKAFTIR